ncbi:hypothetical protein MHI48_20305 [Paenibacillus sp. FSL H7-0942]|uniref:hypothetical protein n=1 Tax=Paenibacillus TaxID=44249 RepID=UPI00096C6EF5|nr:hypothetical protein [Paenibacillus amylolyticus]OMF06290.1 hypothetical protein BK129_11445 [Paenibacillus amylolyticus]
MSDWIKQAAGKAKDQAEVNDALFKKVKLIESNFTDYSMQLWLKFDEVFKEIKAEFGDNAKIHANGNQLRITIGDVEINGIAKYGEYFGGYYGDAQLTYSSKSATSSKELPVTELSLKGPDNPTWVYNKPVRDKLFGRDEVEEIFKTAMWQYLD